MDKFLKILQNIDRRILYIVVAVIVSVPLVIMPNYHPKHIFKEVQDAYDTFDNMPNDKVAFLSTVYSGSTQVENGEQLRAILNHLFSKNKKVVIIAFDQAGAKLTYDLAKEISDKHNKVYGEDWLHLGYKIPNLSTLLRGMGTDFPNTYKTEVTGKKIIDFPLGKQVKNAKDIGVVCDITPSNTLESWIAYFSEPYQVPLVYCPSAVLAANAYPYIDSGQIKGMLNGVIGASQYETLIGEDKTPTKAGSISLSLSLAHLVILAFIVIGNIAFLLSKRRAK